MPTGTRDEGAPAGARRRLMLGALKRWLGGAREAPRPAPGPTAADAQPLYEQALAACEAGDRERAAALAQAAVDRAHDHAGAHLLLGQLACARGATEEAADCYTLAACFAPRLAEPHFALGVLHLDAGDHGAARPCFERALDIEPGHARAHNGLAAALIGLEAVEAARAHLERAVALDPALADAHANLGYLLIRDYGETEAGRHHLERALERVPEHPAARASYTMLLLRDAPAAAVAACDRLLAEQPDLDPVRLNRGLARLTLGEFAAGWDDYEARKSVRCNYVARRMPWPAWDGEPLAGRRLYVHTEQGLGDEIMFASCLPDLLRASGPCVVECSPKLQRLFARSFAAEVRPPPAADADLAAAASRIDGHVALGSLPRRFRRSAGDFPAHDGYLRADEGRVTYWREQLGGLPPGLKVGIAWRGGLRSTRQAARSMRLADWLPILSTPGATFLDLQHVDCPDERASVAADHGIDVRRWPEAHADYDDTAALVSALDLVISVQTALVHLAGALGRETWGLIAMPPEWRYLGAGARMPWYPAVRLFRQATPGDWSGPVSEVATRLRERAHA